MRLKNHFFANNCSKIIDLGRGGRLVILSAEIPAAVSAKYDKKYLQYFSKYVLYIMRKTFF